MATPIINELALPSSRILVLPDEQSESTGVIFRRSALGGGFFKGSSDPEISSDHVLFIKEIATPVEIDEVEYLAMHVNAVVGIIPE